LVDHSLQLRLSQKLALAPQLQQAIKLLQLTRIELREYLQQTVEANPLLEHVEPGMEGATEAADGSDEWDSAAPEQEHEQRDEPDYGQEADDWAEGSSLSEQWGEGGSFAPDQQAQIVDQTDGSLREHLLFQISLAHFSPTDAAIATAIVFALDDEGYLVDTLAEIRDSLAPETLVEEAEVLAVLHRIQRMEPVGVATRDPAECIRVQLSALPANTPRRELALRIARDFIDLVADHDIEQLKKETGAADDTLQAALELIQSLEPRPGARFDNRQHEYLVPDVYVRQVEGRWVAYLSPDNDPRLKLNKYYIRLLRQSGGKDREYLNGRLQEARWLLSSLELRNRTLISVSQAIVDAQQGFFEHGDIALKPLILKEISEVAGVHESTVSRATTRKYMLTPRGMYELKHFFSSHVRTVDGGEVSATAVKARIGLLIDAEAPGKPLSDQKLCSLLRADGICAARRTVAKYREALGIGSSSERRKAYKRLSARARAAGS
jgi:RNA polymerase sigma-54 factor